MEGTAIRPAAHRLSLLKLTGTALHARAVVRRLGGAYGGKVARSMPVAAAAALAARVTGQRTRLMLNRNDDMRMNGGARLALQTVASSAQ